MGLLRVCRVTGVGLDRTSAVKIMKTAVVKYMINIDPIFTVLSIEELGIDHKAYLYHGSTKVTSCVTCSSQAPSRSAD